MCNSPVFYVHTPMFEYLFAKSEVHNTAEIYHTGSLKKMYKKLYAPS